MDRILPLFAATLLVACTGGEDANPAADNAKVQPTMPKPLQGLWGLSKTDCTLEPGSSSTAPMSIYEGVQASELIFPDNKCGTKNISVMDEQTAVELVLDCDTGYLPTNFYLRLRGDTLMVQDKTGSTTWTRCSGNDPSYSATDEKSE
ncbi:MAG: hypothetical protein AAF986_01425 [Pseudomonadota bacterium]